LKASFNLSIKFKLQYESLRLSFKFYG